MSLQKVTADDVAGQLNGVADTTAKAVADGALRFYKVDCYTTFLAEYAFNDADVVIHLFPPVEKYVPMPSGARQVEQSYLRYWMYKFPAILSPVAESYFQASRPRVEAAYVPEMASWWMRCRNFAHRLSPDGYVLRFFARLDEALDLSSPSVGASS